MQLSPDLVKRVHRQELTPAQAFALQAGRDPGLLLDHRAMVAIAAWTRHHAPDLLARADFHLSGIEPRRSEAEGGDGSIKPCILRRRRLELFQAAKAAGFTPGSAGVPPAPSSPSPKSEITHPQSPIPPCSLELRRQAPTAIHAYLVGKGPSLDLLAAADFPIVDAPVLCLNEAIHAIEKLGLPNPLFCVQQDTSLAQRCRPGRATWFLSAQAWDAGKGSTHRSAVKYTPKELGLKTKNLTARAALCIIGKAGGFGHVHFRAFDACVSGDCGYADSIGESPTKRRKNARRFVGFCKEIERQATNANLTQHWPTSLPQAPSPQSSITDHQSQVSPPWTVACVLRTGGDFLPDHVLWLQAQARARIKDPFRFVCLTDLPEIPGVETIPLQHDWPRWWPKIELFRPGLFPGPVAYLDLDMVILRDLQLPDPATLPSRGIAVHRDLRNRKNIGSALMLWNQGAADFLYTHFADSATDFMRTYKGDQDFIHATLQAREAAEAPPPWTWASYKWHIKAHGPDGFDIAAFHGKPRPWDVQEPWIPTFPAPPQAMPSRHGESQHALVICWWGGEPTRVAAARRALSHTAKLDRAGDVYFVERMPASGESRFPELPTEWIRLPIPHDPRAAGLFLKEAYWNYGARRAIEDGHASLAFLDADYWVEDVAWLRDTASCVVDGVLLQPWTTWVESGSKRGGSMASGRGTSPGGSLALTVRTFEDMGGWYEGCIQGGGDAVNYARLTGKKAKWNELKFMYVQHAISRYKAKPLAVNALPHTLHHERHNIGETYKGAQRGIPLDLFCGTRVERVLTVDAHGLPVVDAATVRGQAFRGYLATSGRRDRDGRFRDVDQARHAAGLGRYLSASEWAAVKDADKWYAIRWTYYNEAIWMLRELFPSDDVLEVGCGKLPLVHDSTRIDQEPVKRGIVHNLDQYPWPVPRGQCVLALQVMEHLADGHRAATEIRRVARGAVVSIPYVWGPSRDKGHAGLDLSTLCDWFEAEPVRVAITGLRPRQRLVAAFMWGASDA